MNKEEIPIFRWNTKTKEFYVLEHKFDGVNSIEDFINYIHNLDKENKQLKADLEMYENGVYFSSENDKLQNEIDNLNHIIDKQDKDITILSKGNKHLKEILEKMGLEPNDILYLQQENKQLKEKLLVTQTNEETFRLEMEDITKTLGLDENTLFDDVKLCARNLKENWNELKEHLKEKIADGRSTKHLWLMGCYDEDKLILEKMQELEQGCDSNENKDTRI